MDREAVSDIELVAGISLITPARLNNLRRAVLATCEVPGDMAELGVYRGGSARVIAGTCPGKTLHLFDTFTGLPFDEDPFHNPTGHDLSRGRFACKLIDAVSILEGCKIDVHMGFFPHSTFGVFVDRFSFVHIDCDLHKSAVDAIEWFWPRMNPGGIMFFDDYGCDFTGVTNAVDAAFAPEMIEKQIDADTGFQIGALVRKT